MSQRESDVFPAEIAVFAQSAADGAANISRLLFDGDQRLVQLIDAWPMLPEDIRSVIARLAGFVPDGLDDEITSPDGAAVSR